MDTYNVVDRSHQKCLSTATVSRYADFRLDYYMIDNHYPNGSGDDCGNETLTCGENEFATPVGSLYPVSSKSNGLLYKNEKCALCHGVNKTDQIPWDIIMICNLQINYVRFDIGAFSQPMEMGKLHKSYSLKFRYPGNHDDVMKHICYENTVHTCKENEANQRHIPDNLNMTEEEIRAACLSDMKAPYMNSYLMNSYLNPFCYLCNTNEHYYHPLKKCDDIGTLGGNRFGVNIFTAIIDISHIEMKPDVAARDKSRPKRIACKTANGQAKISDDCRPAICPLGRIALDHTCVFLYTELLTELQIVLKLYLWTDIPVSTHEYVKSLVEAGVGWRTLLSAKGLRSWSLNGLFCYTDSQSNGTETVGYFWIQLVLVNKKTNFPHIISNVDQLMTHNWTLFLNNSTLFLKAQFSDFEKVQRVDNQFYMAVYANGANNGAINPIRDISPHTLKLTYLNIITAYPSITKMFFCDQIALKNEEYQLDHYSYILYYNATGKTYLRTEFASGFDANDELEPRLCLKDASYVLQTQQRSSSWSCFPLTNRKLTVAMIIVFFISAP